MNATLSRLIIGFIALLLCNEASSQTLSKADYARADSVLKRSGRVYSSFVRPHWIGESNEFWYVNHERGGDVYYMVDAEAGRKKQVEKQEDAPREAPQRDFRSHRDTSKVPSPDKQWEAYIRDNNLCVRPVGGRGEIILSLDGTDKAYYSARLQWSPDSRRIATLKVIDVEERRIPLIRSSPSAQLQPQLEWRDYAKPGDVLPVYLPTLFDIKERRQIALDTDQFVKQFSLRLTGWRKDSRAFTFEFNQRGHQRYTVAEVEAASGQIRRLVDETSPTFIYYNNVIRRDIDDGRLMIWASERDGWRHLYLIDCATGKIKNQITQGEWVVRSLDHVDEKNGLLYFYASGLYDTEDPYNRHYCRIQLNGGGFRDLTPENGNHELSFSRDRKYYVDAYSRPDMPPVSLLKRTIDGSLVMELERCDVSDLRGEGWQPIEVFRAKGRDGVTDIWGNIHRPSGFDPSRKYPVVEFIYAGPHDSHVDKAFRPAHHLVSKLVELGFIVVSIDGMGTANRSKAFHDVCWKNLKDAGFPDRKLWIRAAANRYPSMDISRVGIYGWSAGGQNAMGALLFHNDFYKVAVSFCGCHDNRMDKIWWNEQWMGYPVDSSYAASSNVDNAALLKGKLLLINGELDDNVDPASTLQVVNALVNAGKNFDQYYLPSKGHSLGSAFEIRQLQDYFVRHLKDEDPPDWD
ncbi:MAG: S9 family peptidase [Tannerellaceae bacterium]|jgi:dipeptidyl aminopeptidase/acylaminoacyl peptidase|nr:S9 family peptidase [Tannerellaceae bacterium]